MQDKTLSEEAPLWQRLVVNAARGPYYRRLAAGRLVFADLIINMNGSSSVNAALRCFLFYVSFS
jgi:hypothetical protein